MWTPISCVSNQLKLTRHFQKLADSSAAILPWWSSIFYLPGWSYYTRFLVSAALFPFFPPPCSRLKLWHTFSPGQIWNLLHIFLLSFGLLFRETSWVFFPHFTAGSAVVLSLTEELHVTFRCARYFFNWSIFPPIKSSALLCGGRRCATKQIPL